MSTVSSRHVTCPLLSYYTSEAATEYSTVCNITSYHRRNEKALKLLSRIYWRASLMPAVAVTSAPEAYTYIAALRGLSIWFLPVHMMWSRGSVHLSGWNHPNWSQQASEVLVSQEFSCIVAKSIGRNLLSLFASLFTRVDHVATAHLNGTETPLTQWGTRGPMRKWSRHKA